jgi:hypothetical protein
MRQMADAMAGNSALRARFTGVMSAGVSPARAPEARRHLILAYRPGWQSVEDLNEIAGHVRDIDPTIRTFIVPNTAQNAVTRRQAAGRPTFVFSPAAMPGFRPLRGKVYQGRAMPKAEEAALMAARGLPVPKTVVLTPGLVLDPGEWGEFVVLKPTDMGTSSQGLGFKVMRTQRVRYLAPSEYPAGHPGRRGPMLVQQFISDRGYISYARVLTVFGEPLYMMRQQSRNQVIDFNAPDETLETFRVAHQSFTDPEMQRTFETTPEELELARAAYRAIPEIPLQGTDIVRDSQGRRFIIEINSRGNTWHFSSSFQAPARAKNGPEFEHKRRYQMDALRTTARVLVAKTNAEAA